MSDLIDNRRDDARWVPPHRVAPQGRARRVVVAVLTVTRIWLLLPGRLQGALCHCAICRGDA